MGTPAMSKLPREVVVRIIPDPKTGEPKATPDPFKVSKKANQVVVWECDSEFSIEFQESPFYESQFDDENNCSGLPRRNVLGNPEKNYKYTIRAFGTVVDPMGVIDR